MVHGAAQVMKKSGNVLLLVSVMPSSNPSQTLSCALPAMHCHWALHGGQFCSELAGSLHCGCMGMPRSELSDWHCGPKKIAIVDQGKVATVDRRQYSVSFLVPTG